jgi:hypothetical protein
MISSTFATDLDIRFDLSAAPPGVNPYSARQMHGILSPIDAAKGNDKLRRTVNGGLVDISAHQMRKYRLEVHGGDDAPPALDGLWLGMQVTVDAHVELAYLSGGSAGRTPVPGSPRVDGGMTYYRPRLIMLVAELNLDRDEWGAHTDWSLVLEEI